MRLKFVFTATVMAFGITALGDRAFAEDDLRATIRDEIDAYEKEKKADPKNDKTFKVYWSDGIRMKSADGKIKFKLGGRVMFDQWYIDDDDLDSGNNPNSRIANSPSGVEFRRVRLYNAGEIGKHFEYKLQFEFAHNVVIARDWYIGVLKLRDCYGCGVPNIKVGHFKVGQGLETTTSSKYITFMERSWLSNFHADRSSGIQFWDVFRGGQLGYQAGIDMNGTAGYEESTSGSGDAFFNEGLGYTGRVWWAPWYDCNCKARRLHVGASVSYRSDADGLRMRARPPAHLFQRVVDTDFTADGPGGELLDDVDDAWILGVELAWVYGAWSIQAEYGQMNVGSTGSGDPTFSAWYVHASYWLTGEARNWKDGVFKRTKPCCNWLDRDCCGKGAWEIAARYEEIDLTDGNITGGEATAWTVGINWHWNPNMRVMFNAMHAETTIPGVIAGTLFTGDTTAFGMRFQVDF